MKTLSPMLAPELEQLGAIVDRLPTGVILVSRDRVDVLYANAAAQRLLHPARLRRGQPLPEPWTDLSLRHYARRLVDPGVAPQEQVTPRAKRTYRVNGIPARDAGLAVILIDDVTDRERQRQAEREFVANAAHELLTPLTGIVSATHVLEAGAKAVPEDRDRFIRHISEECTRLARIARALLVLARAQSGEEPPRLEVVRLCDALQEAVAEIDGHVVEIDCPGDLTVLADVDLLAQALTNLVRNLVGHGSGGAIQATAVAVGSVVEVRLVDRGGTLPRGPNLGRRFHSGAGRDGGGFGLGLSIATQSIEALGGALRLEQRDGVVASIELPSGRLAEQ